MGKKRVAEAEEGGLDNPTINNIESELPEKKMKTQASDTEETDAPSSSTKETDAPSTSTKKSSANPMENKKERRRKNKIRHLEDSEIAEPNPKKIALELKNDPKMETSPSSSGGGNLPQFHIGLFKDLSAADSSAREAAVVMLVTELQEVQKAYEQLENKEAVDGELKLEADMEDGLDMCAPSLRYAVRRLIRGVSSSREYARPGFALGLSILVSAVPSIRTDSLLQLIVHLVEITSSMKGQEKRDCLLGRLFAYGAISRSGRLTEEFIRDKDTPYIKEFISAVLVLANKKRYLQEPAVSIIWELAEKLPVEALQHHFFEAPEVQEWFGSATEKGNPDALLLALKMRDKVGVDDNTFGNLFPSPYSPSNLFSADHLSSIALCLKESTFCQPRIHSVWPTLLNILLPDSVIKDFDPASVLNSTKKHKKSRKGEDDIEKSLRSFCEVILDGSLLSSSHDRKNLAFDILLLLLPKLPAYYVNIVLSHKLVQCLMDVLSTKDTWLFKVAEHFMKELSEWVKNDNVRRVAVIVALQRHSNGRFDSITRTKTVKILMMEIKSESACMHLLQELMSLFLDEGHTSEEPSDQSQTTDENSERGFVDAKESNGIGFSDILKSWVIESLPGILKHLEVDPNSKFKVQREILKFLVVQGLFSSTLGSEVTSFDLHEKFKWPKSAISSALCRMCIEQLQSLLSSAQKGEGSHALAVGAEANDLGSYFMHFVNTLRSIPSVSLYRSLNDDDEEAFKKINEMEALLAREERNYTSNVGLNKCHVLRYLLIQLLLQILLRPGEFYEAASELVMCCKSTLAPLDLLGSSGEDEPVEDGASLVMDVLVDTMLSLLPQSSAPMRIAIEQTFKYFCDDMTDDGLVRMLRIVKKDLKPARRHNNDGDDEDDDDILGIEDDTESDEDETSETAESDKQNDDSEAVKGADEDRAKLQDASDESDGGMDDDAMFRMDTYLARIFKERKNQHSGDSAPSQLILFKLRVLSLLEIYLHENPGDPRVLTIFQNLAQALINPYATKGSEQLSQRIWGIMQKKIFKAKVFPRGESIQLPSLESLLEKFLKLTSRPFRKKTYAPNVSKKKQSASWDRHKMINSLAQNSTFWILKIIESRNFSKGKLERTFEILSTILVDYFDSKKSLLKPDFLKEIFKRRPWVGHHLCNFLLEKCSGAKLQFRQVEGLDLVLEVLKSLAPASSDHDQAKKTMKKKVPKLCHLIKVLVTNMPEKKSRRADVKKFCSKVFGLLSTLDLSRSFLKALEPDTHAACESQLGDAFLALTKRES